MEEPFDELLGIQHTQSSLSILLNATVTKQVHCLQYGDELTKKGSQQTKGADQQNGSKELILCFVKLDSKENLI